LYFYIIVMLYCGVMYYFSSYHSEKDVMMTVAEEVSQLTHGSHKYIIQQLHTFINRQQSDCLVTLN